MIFRVRFQMSDGRNNLAVFGTKAQADKFCLLVERSFGRVIASDDKPQDFKLGTHNKV